MTFEYKIEPLYLDTDKTVHLLNHYGADGWELVSVVRLASNEHMGVFYLKRPRGSRPVAPSNYQGPG